MRYGSRGGWSVVAKTKDPTFEARVDALRQHPRLSSYAAGWLDSVKTQVQNGLTEKQVNFLLKLETEYLGDGQEKYNQWKAQWTPEKQERWDASMAYIESSPTYWGRIINEWKKDKTAIPEESLFVKVTENYYVKRFLVNRAIPPKFELGTMVEGKYGGVGMVVENKEVTGWVKGSRPVVVAWATANVVSDIMEKELKKYKLPS